jgi:hypothetical protein
MSPDCQRLTLRAERRTHSIIDSHGFVDASVRLSPQAGNDTLNSTDGVRANDLIDGGSGSDVCNGDEGDERRSCG